LSEQAVDKLFEVRASGVDLVLNFDLNFGLGYGLSGGMVPIGPRACFWGGFGGSLIVMDQEAQLTVSYMMNKMGPELLGDLRGFALALTAGAAAVA
jgi:CubicO group peptidase (beta-lactamase class C family)